MDSTERKKQNLDISLELGRASVIYADEKFTVYITLKNISDEPLYIWNFGILESTELSFIRGADEHEKSYKIKPSGRSYRRVTEEKEFTNDEIEQLFTHDFLKDSYYKLIKDKGYVPWELLSGEAFSECFSGKTQKYLFFRPDKYKLTLFVEYSNKQKIFFRETKIEEVDILASFQAIMFGAIIGGFLGTVVRIFIFSPFILDISSLFEIVGAVILSVLAVIALARKSGVQTLITIQDFWGGVFVGFLIGYSGKTFFDNLVGIT